MYLYNIVKDVVNPRPFSLDRGTGRWCFITKPLVTWVSLEETFQIKPLDFTFKLSWNLLIFVGISMVYRSKYMCRQNKLKVYEDKNLTTIKKKFKRNLS